MKTPLNLPLADMLVFFAEKDGIKRNEIAATLVVLLSHQAADIENARCASTLLPWRGARHVQAAKASCGPFALVRLRRRSIMNIS
jgi:hypothetical protein